MHCDKSKGYIIQYYIIIYKIQILITQNLRTSKNLIHNKNNNIILAFNMSVYLGVLNLIINKLKPSCLKVFGYACDYLIWMIMIIKKF